MAGSLREERAARNEDLFRQLNDRLHVLAALSPAEESREQLVCECVAPTCSLVVELTADEYRSVRQDGARFLVYPSDEHTDPEVERVVQRSDRFWVVEKTGRAGEEAEYLADYGPNML